jgi:hypothetical protein
VQYVTLPTDNYKATRIARYSLVGLEDKVCINVIHKDEDYLHTHPWGYITFILYGGYYERLLVNKKIVKRKCGFGTILYRTHNQFHGIKLINKKSVSLFIKLKQKSHNTRWIKDGIEQGEASFWLKQGYKKEDLKKMFEQSKQWLKMENKNG